MLRAQFSLCNKLQRVCDQNHSLVPSYSCFSRSKPDTAYFPTYLQGTTGCTYSLLPTVLISTPGSSWLFCTACAATAVRAVWQEECEVLQPLCHPGLLRGITALPQVSQGNLTNRFQVVKPVFWHAASDIHGMLCNLRTNNKMSFFLFYTGKWKPNQTELDANEFCPSFYVVLKSQP